jgi:aminoglycoside phosphotransferase family enzyme
MKDRRTSGDTVASHRDGLPSIERKVACLRQPPVYPERPATVEVIETHMSWVFLTPEHAYKLKKPVRTDFLDFSTLEARDHDCKEELRLNRRLAPDVYIEVVPLVVSPNGELRLGRPGEVIDWLVKMRRLPADRMLDAMIRRATLTDADVEQVATLLTRFYQGCPAIAIDGAQYRARLEEKIRTNHKALREPDYGLSRPVLQTIHDGLSLFLEHNPGVFDARTAARIVEGHGDLRPEHICLERRPVIFDCLEFNRQFRIIDTADELAFLDMECTRLGDEKVGQTLFRTYSALSEDRPGPSLLSFYKANSACLRAKLAVWHLRDVAQSRRAYWLDHAAQYLELARRYVEDLRR